jgi:hypothetical protein
VTRLPLLPAYLPLLMLSAPAMGQEAVRLMVQPERIELVGPNARHRLLVTAIAADGRQTDVTGMASFTSSKPECVVVDRNGECRSVASGEASVRIIYAGQSAEVVAVARDTGSPRPPSFRNDLTPLFTRLGCNQGACHGKGAGQNGFRLSLRGYAPESDYEYLTREFLGRRVDPTVPADSLLLRKPLGQAPHEGGKLISVGSREYQVLLDWIGAGLPGPLKDEVTPQELVVLPGNRVLRPGQTQQLLVRVRYSDNTWRDVTWLSQFASNDAGVVSVDAWGLATVNRNGETALRVSFQGLVAVLVLTAPFDKPVDPARLAIHGNFIDDHVYAKLGALRIEPSDLCNDSEFLRRATLDTCGVLPTSEEVRSFLADNRPDKRARKIDELLQRPEFIDHWTLQLGDLLQNRKERDHDVRGTKGVRDFHDWLRQQVADNRPWDELARDVLTATGSTTVNPAVGYYVVTVGENREVHRSEVVASVAQAFLGTRIGCAQCHNHPLEKYTQDDYYHFAAFFSRIKLERKEAKQGPTILRVADYEGKTTKNPVGVSQPRTGQFMKPQPLDRSTIEIPADADPRVRLASWITDPKNEAFSGAMVNRLWKHYLGVGLVEPVDDLRASNPPTNPALWRALNQEFVSHKFDLRQLMRVILNSRTYQLSAATRPGNESDTRFYSHYLARRLPAEVLLDALSQSTGVPDTFPGYPVGTRAGQLSDPTLKSYFLTVFGRSERVTACACERNGEVTLPQLLHMQNGSSVVQKIQSGDGRVAQLVKSGKTPEAIIDELFLASVSRLPHEAERQTVRKVLAECQTDGERNEFYRDLLWALLNSKEFSFNH